jgi:hypothetical protein
MHVPYISDSLPTPRQYTALSLRQLLHPSCDACCLPRDLKGFEILVTFIVTYCC